MAGPRLPNRKAGEVTSLHRARHRPCGEGLGRPCGPDRDNAAADGLGASGRTVPSTVAAVARTGFAAERGAGPTASAVGDTDDGAEVMGDAGAGSSAGWPRTGGVPAPRTVAERMNRAAIRNGIGMLVECRIVRRLLTY
jgi:hypothetical protein